MHNHTPTHTHTMPRALTRICEHCAPTNGSSDLLHLHGDPIVVPSTCDLCRREHVPVVFAVGYEQAIPITLN